jgi:hypothetical protein
MMDPNQVRNPVQTRDQNQDPIPSLLPDRSRSRQYLEAASLRPKMLFLLDSQLEEN